MQQNTNAKLNRTKAELQIESLLKTIYKRSPGKDRGRFPYNAHEKRILVSTNFNPLLLIPCPTLFTLWTVLLLTKPVGESEVGYPAVPGVPDGDINVLIFTIPAKLLGIEYIANV